MIVKVRLEAPALDGTRVRIVVLSEADDVLVDVYDVSLKDAVAVAINRFRVLQEATLEAFEQLGIRIHTSDLDDDAIPEVLPS